MCKHRNERVLLSGNVRDFEIEKMLELLTIIEHIKIKSNSYRHLASLFFEAIFKATVFFRANK